MRICKEIHLNHIDTGKNEIWYVEMVYHEKDFNMECAWINSEPRVDLYVVQKNKAMDVPIFNDGVR